MLCALCWGPSYLFIKVAVHEVPPLTIAFSRVAIGTAILYIVCRLTGQKLLKWRHLWKQFAVMGITLNAIPFFLVSSGEVFIPSSLAGILNSTTLIFTSVVAHFFGRHDPLSRNKILGIIAGIIGLAIIYLPTLIHESIHSQIGAAMVVLACLSAGIGTVYARTHLHKVPGVVALTFQLLIACIILAPICILIDNPSHLAPPTHQALLSLIALGVLSTAGGFYIYFRAIQLAGPTYASFSVLFLPIIAMFCGALFLGEQLSWNLYLGIFFILAGVLVINPAAVPKRQ